MSSALAQTPFPTVDPAALVAFAESIDGVAEGLRRAGQDMARICATTRHDWTGAAANSFGSHSGRQVMKISTALAALAPVAPAVVAFAESLVAAGEGHRQATRRHEVARPYLPATATAVAQAAADQRTAVAAVGTAGERCASVLRRATDRLAYGDLFGPSVLDQFNSPMFLVGPSMRATTQADIDYNRMLDDRRQLGEWFGAAGNVSDRVGNVIDDGLVRGRRAGIMSVTEEYTRNGVTRRRWLRNLNGPSMGTAQDVLAQVGRGDVGSGWLRSATPWLNGAGRVARPLSPILNGAEQYANDSADPTLTSGQRTRRVAASVSLDAAGGAVGAWAGAKGGAAVGAAIGVWFGGVGAAPGAVIGGAIGAIGGAWAGSEAGKAARDSVFEWDDRQRSGVFR